jgi:hypothetical protein
MRHVVIATLALCVLGADTEAQATERPSTRSYGVRAWFQGEEMLPWESELTVTDTAVDGGAAVHVHYRSRFVEGRWLFDDVAVWTANGSWTAKSVGKGRRGDSSCDLVANAGRVTGSTHVTKELTPRITTERTIPSFAFAAWLSRQELRGGDTVRVTVIRCVPQNGTDAIEAMPFVGTVSAVNWSRAPGAAAEDAWQVEPASDYGGGAIIAKRDRSILRFTTPQGTVGYSIDSIRP